MRHALLPLVFTIACVPTEEAFPDKVAASYCSGLKTCDVDRFWDTYPEGTPDCREEVSDDVAVDGTGRGVAACSYVPEEALACIDRVRAATCDELLGSFFLSRCGDAWDCITIFD